MRSFIVGILLGMCFGETVTTLAKDALNRSQQQQQYDYFRERQQQLDIGHMRKQLDKQEFDRKYGRMPC
ncbi:hypothetical protein [Nitrospira sp. BLG_2]|uniref:hypothetical protein n=1 Tax=Nitrospira sp. BLG_2 TaxID=3397507 RepID=UPI003B9D01A6